jgi:uncharacterized protein involved in cysteine biosynthesis
MKKKWNYFYYPFRVLFLLPKLPLKKYFFFLFLMTIMLSFIMIVGIYFFVDSILKVLLEIYLLEFKYLLAVLNILLTLQLFFLFFAFYRIIAQLVILPFLEPLRKALENKYNVPSAKETTFKQDIINMFYGLYKSILFILIYLFLFFLTIFLGPFQNVILFLYDSYILGNEIFDAYWEKEYPHPKERSKKLKEQKIEMLLTGMASTMILFIPIFGVFLSTICGYMSVFFNHHRIRI